MKVATFYAHQTVVAYALRRFRSRRPHVNFFDRTLWLILLTWTANASQMPRYHKARIRHIGQPGYTVNVKARPRDFVKSRSCRPASAGLYFLNKLAGIRVARERLAVVCQASPQAVR